MKPLLLDKLPLESAMDNLPAPVIITDDNGDIFYVNKTTLNLYGYGHSDELTLNIGSLFSSEEEENYFKEVLQNSFELENSNNRFVGTHKTKQGNLIDVDLKWTVVKSPHTYLIFVVEDITDAKIKDDGLEKLYQLEEKLKKLKNAELNLRKSYQRLLSENSFLKAREEANQAMLKELASTNDFLERLALEDSLTGVYNRRYFSQSLETELIRAIHLKEPLALLLIDLDYFKKINDTHGHIIGDEILKIVAATIQDLVGPHNILCRYGGEEFGVISLGTDIKAGEKLAYKISDHLAHNPIAIDQHKVTVTVSIGVSSIYPARWKAPMEAILDYLLKTADMALYKAKSSGRNTVEVYKRSSA